MGCHTSNKRFSILDILSNNAGICKFPKAYRDQDETKTKTECAKTKNKTKT